MFPIRWNDIFRKKDGTLGTMEDLEGGGSSLPEYSESDAGKILGVDEEGLLEWKEMEAGAKIYYKEWTRTVGSDQVLAAFSNDAAVSSGIHIARFSADYGYNDITVDGYTPISAYARDIYTGYQYAAFIERSGAKYKATYILGSRAIETSGVHLIVFYVKDEDIELLA